MFPYFHKALPTKLRCFLQVSIAGGADMVRVHDTRAMVRVARMSDAVVRGAPAEAATWDGAPLSPDTTA